MCVYMCIYVYIIDCGKPQNIAVLFKGFIPLPYTRAMTGYSKVAELIQNLNLIQTAKSPQPSWMENLQSSNYQSAHIIYDKK